MTTGNREQSGPALPLAGETEVEQPAGGMLARSNGLNLHASAVIDGKDRDLVERVWRHPLRELKSLGTLKQRDEELLTYCKKKRRGTVMALSPFQPRDATREPHSASAPSYALLLRRPGGFLSADMRGADGKPLTPPGSGHGAGSLARLQHLPRNTFL